MDALDLLEEQCRLDPQAVLRSLLARLRAQPAALAVAARGRPVHVRLSIDHAEPHPGWIVFTADGNVAVLGDDVLKADERSPDLFLQGPGRSVLAAVLGLVDLAQALDAGVLVLMVPIERVEALLAVVRAELAAVAADYTAS